MSSGSELASLADACRLAPDDPGARAKLIEHCKEAQQVSSPLLEALADIARTEEGREAVMVAELLQTLLNRAETDFAGEEMALQACRLGGNLCFDSPQGRRLVEEAGLLRLLTIAVPHLPSPPGKLWQVLPAFLHNYCADSPACLSSVIDLVHAAALHYSNLQATETDQDESGIAVEAWSSFLSGLTEHEGKLVLFCKPVVLASLLHMLKLTRDHEVCQALVDLLQDLADDETFSCQALELGLIDLILARIGSGQEDLETACLDLLALLSSHPEALEQMLLPSSPLPPLLSSWLSSGQPQHVATAALVYGNFCTNDDNCGIVAATSVPATLVTLLHPESDAKVLHAVTGCLRNLAVCRAARESLCSLFLPQAVVELLLHLASTSNHTVTPKLVAALRLVTQGEKAACKQLGQRQDLLACLVSISQFSLVPALAIETARLIASIVRHAEDAATLAFCIQQQGCLPLISSLLNSPHPQLINEAVVVLVLACSSSPKDPSLSALDIAFLSSRLAATLSLPTCPPEIKSNIVRLVSSLVNWEEDVVAVLRGDGELKTAIQQFDSQSDVALGVLARL